jgi:general secretion pathway protein A
MKRNKGAALLTGEVGCGKTTLSRVVIEKLPEKDFDIALITNPSLESIDFLKEVLYQFGLNSETASKAELIEARSFFLFISSLRRWGSVPLL